MGRVKVDLLNTVDGPTKLVPAARAEAGASGPNIVTRAEWGADESIKSTSGGCSRSFWRVQQLFVHHTAGVNNDPDPEATMRAIYWYHTKSRGWCDIGYNFVIGPDGSIFEGRWARSYMPWESHTGEDAQGRAVSGAHVANFNSGSVGISMMGNFQDVRSHFVGARFSRRDPGVGVEPSRSEAQGLAPLREPGLRPYEATEVHLGSQGRRRHGMSRRQALRVPAGHQAGRRRPGSDREGRFEGHATDRSQDDHTKRTGGAVRHSSATETATRTRRGRSLSGRRSLEAGGARRDGR